MGVRYFDEWTEKERLVKHGPLHFLKGSVIGIDATHFSKQFVVDPLLTALGGAPLALEGFANAVENLRAAGIGLHFVFNGLQYAKTENPFASSDFINTNNDAAFVQYEGNQPEPARRSFQALATPKLDEHMGTFKTVLCRMNVPFTVAPYSALAQLAYYEKHPSQFIDAVYGPSELFYFGVDKVITGFTDFLPDQDPEKVTITDHLASPDKLQFSWVDSSLCMRALGNVHSQVFIEALVLAGSGQFINTFPPLMETAIYKQSGIIRDAVNLLISTRGNVSQLCDQYPDPSLKDVWLDKYKQVMTIIKHHVVITIEGDVESLDKDHAPADTHECIGLRLPEELYMYLSRGMIRTRVLNWLTRGEVIVATPLAGTDAETCHHFVKVQLEPLRKMAICLLTEGIHRYYQRADVKTRYWFDKSNEIKFKPVDVTPSPRSTVSKWNVKKELVGEAKAGKSKPGSLAFAVCSLHESEFAKGTVTQKSKDHKLLIDNEEILANSLWRLLQLREFVDEKHELTRWGRILEAALAASEENNELQESVFLAIELLRFGVLNANTMFPGYPGSPARGSVNDKGYCMLVSRVASLGRLRHKPHGYCGPLSRSLLAYHSLVDNLQSGMRDLLEMTMISMFLDGSIERDRIDWMDLSLALPFHEPFSCGLGIATLNYLDNLGQHGNPTDKTTQQLTLEQAQGWFQYSDFEPSLNDAFRLWDAVYAGVREAGDLVQDNKMWQDTDIWLSHRR